jgi:hypothetical protein
MSVDVSFRLLISVVSKGLKGLIEREFLVVGLDKYFGDFESVCS